MTSRTAGERSLKGTFPIGCRGCDVMKCSGQIGGLARAYGCYVRVCDLWIHTHTHTQHNHTYVQVYIYKRSYSHINMYVHLNVHTKTFKHTLMHRNKTLPHTRTCTQNTPKHTHTHTKHSRTHTHAHKTLPNTHKALPHTHARTQNTPTHTHITRQCKIILSDLTSPLYAPLIYLRLCVHYFNPHPGKHPVYIYISCN